MNHFFTEKMIYDHFFAEEVSFDHFFTEEVIFDHFFAEEVISDYFFCTYFKQSRVTAVRMMIPSNTNCRFVSIPKIVRE